MLPRELIKKWITLFNQCDVNDISDLYHEDAINHQVTREPVVGKENIKKMFEEDFAVSYMICIVENIFEDDEWAILEWIDPLGLRGCGFFHIIDGKIKFQRGYWDELSFLRKHNLPIPLDQ